MYIPFPFFLFVSEKRNTFFFVLLINKSPSLLTCPGALSSLPLPPLQDIPFPLRSEFPSLPLLLPLLPEGPVFTCT